MKYKIILASNSPRRRELLAGADIDFIVDTRNNFVEGPEAGVDPHQVPLDMSIGKSHGFHRPLAQDELLITADTVVICPVGGSESKKYASAFASVVLGKPRDADDAARMLRMLSGRSHEVVTGVTLRSSTREFSFSDMTRVHFKELSDADIAYYLERYKPFDKAGAYGIQEWIGYIGIRSVEGSYFNVMGLPVDRVRDAILDFEGRN